MFGRIRYRRLHDTFASIISAFSGACFGRLSRSDRCVREPRLFDASSEPQVVRVRAPTSALVCCPVPLLAEPGIVGGR